MKENIARFVAATVLGLGAYACTSESSQPDLCKDNSISYSIPGSKDSVAAAEKVIRAQSVAKFDLYPTNNDNFKQQIGNLIVPDSPGLTRPGTAAIYHPDREIANGNLGMLGILTDVDYTKSEANRRFQGFLTAGNRELQIVDINTERVKDAYTNTDSTVELDNSVKNKELIKVKFDLGDSPLDLKTVGFETLSLDIQVVDCDSGNTLSEMGRSFQLNPVDSSNR